MLTAQAIAEFSATLRGRIVQPDDADYDASRRVYNAMIDRHPRLIVYCRDVADVMRCVDFAREQSLRLAVRGGGHNGGGLGVCDDGLVIDLSAMKGIRVDAAARTVRVEGGCTWGDVDHATHAFGMATPSGIIATTGVGGLTLGGGIGHLTRKCGLTIDNLLEADVVLADGRLVTRQRRGEPGSVLGAARRRRQFRRRHLVPVPPASGGPGGRRPDLLAAGARLPRSCAGIASSSSRRRRT